MIKIYKEYNEIEKNEIEMEENIDNQRKEKKYCNI